MTAETVRVPMDRREIFQLTDYSDTCVVVRIQFPPHYIEKQILQAF